MHKRIALAAALATAFASTLSLHAQSGEVKRTGDAKALFSSTITVGDTAVYVGTLALERIVFNRQLRVAIQDEYERALATLRTQYPELPSVVGRGLMRPAA